MVTSAASSVIGIPLAWYQQMRETSPVYLDPRMGLWNVFRYEDALTVLTDPETFSSAPVPGSRQPKLPSILGMDEPRHRKLRNIVSQAFTPRMVSQLAPKISEITNGLLDAVLPQGKMDVVSDLAYPLPLTVIAELLGVPAEDRPKFRELSTIIVSGPRQMTSPGMDHVQAVQTFRGYFAQKLEEHRAQPREDLISQLLAAEVDGEKLTEEELLDFCQLLLIAGHETTANLIGNAMVCFDERPEVVEELRADPSLMKGAVEEILRCYPSVPGATRVTTRATELGGQKLEKNQTVSIHIASANYDERQFAEPERFDIRRTPNHHLGFGHGIHFCLGAPLARLEANIALTLLLERLKDFRRDPEQEVKSVQSFLTFGVQHFPLLF